MFHHISFAAYPIMVNKPEWETVYRSINNNHRCMKQKQYECPLSFLSAQRLRAMFLQCDLSLSYKILFFGFFQIHLVKMAFGLWGMYTFLLTGFVYVPAPGGERQQEAHETMLLHSITLRGAYKNEISSSSVSNSFFQNLKSYSFLKKVLQNQGQTNLILDEGGVRALFHNKGELSNCGSRQRHIIFNKVPFGTFLQLVRKKNSLLTVHLRSQKRWEQ